MRGETKTCVSPAPVAVGAAPFGEASSHTKERPVVDVLG